MGCRKNRGKKITILIFEKLYMYNVDKYFIDNANQGSNTWICTYMQHLEIAGF